MALHGLRLMSLPPANVGAGSTEAEPFGKDEGIDLSIEAGGNIFRYVLYAAKPAAKGSLIPCLPRKRGPRDASGTPGRTSDPLTKHIRPRKPRKRGGDLGTPAEPQGVHPTLWQCTLSHACHVKRRRPRDASGTPGRIPDPLAVHPTPWQYTLFHACHTKEAETQGRQRYIRPLDSAHYPTPATQKRRRPSDASGTPGRTSDRLAVHIVPRLPRKRRGNPKEAETQGRQRPGAYIRPLGSANCPAPATQKRRRPWDRGVHPTP